VDPGSPREAPSLRAEFQAANSDGRRIEILFAMESVEYVLTAVRDEDLIASPLISLAAVRLQQLWAGDDAEVRAALARIRGGVGPVERYVLLSALVIEHRFRELEGSGPAVVDVQSEVLGAYYSATEPEFRYRVVNACSTYSPETAYLLLEDVRTRPRDATLSHPQLSTQVAAALALGQMLDLGKGTVVDPSVAEGWSREFDTVVSITRTMVRDPAIDPLAFRHMVRALGRHSGVGELELIREGLRDGDPVLLEVLRKEQELLEKGG